MERNWNCQRLGDFFDDFWKNLTFLFEKQKKSIENVFAREFLTFFTRELWRFGNIEGFSHGFLWKMFAWAFFDFYIWIFDDFLENSVKPRFLVKFNLSFSSHFEFFTWEFRKKFMWELYKVFIREFLTIFTQELKRFWNIEAFSRGYLI